MAAKLCPHCGKLSDRTWYCEFCRADLSAIAAVTYSPPPEPPRVQPCPKCWEPIHPPNRTCSRCGATLDDTPGEPPPMTIRSRVELAVIGLVVVVLAAFMIKEAADVVPSSGGSAGTGSDAAAVADVEPARTFNGDGTTESSSFPLDGGDYALAWTITGGDDGCVLVLGLQEDAGTYESFVGPITTDSAGTESGTGHVRGVPAGTHRLDVYGSCPWTVTVSPE